ncbi:hypothetical protein D3C76_1327290 [compost metagenome]
MDRVIAAISVNRLGVVGAIECVVAIIALRDGRNRRQIDIRIAVEIEGFNFWATCRIKPINHN